MPEQSIEITEDKFALPDDWGTACYKSWVCWDASEGTALFRRCEVSSVEAVYERITMVQAAQIYAAALAHKQHGEFFEDLAEDDFIEYFVAVEWGGQIGPPRYARFRVVPRLTVTFNAEPVLGS